MPKVVQTKIDSDTKTVTIRDVNKALYDQFALLSTRIGMNVGDLFSQLISNYGKRYHPFLVIPQSHEYITKLHEDNPIEMIRDIEKLTVTKHDLEAAGEEVRYIFRNIDHLKFDSSVNNEVLMKHVLRINKSGVETEGKISKLFLKSIIQRQIFDSYYDDLDKETTNITIRNVDEQKYAEFSAICQEQRIKMGDAVNELLKRGLPHFELSQILTTDPKINPLEVIVVGLHQYLEVSNQDLIDLQGRNVVFHRIDTLKFLDDVDNEIFKNKVIGIYNCTTVSFPKQIAKLLQLSRNKTFP